MSRYHVKGYQINRQVTRFSISCCAQNMNKVNFDSKYAYFCKVALVF